MAIHVPQDGRGRRVPLLGFFNYGRQMGSFCEYGFFGECQAMALRGREAEGTIDCQLPTTTVRL